MSSRHLWTRADSCAPRALLVSQIVLHLPMVVAAVPCISQLPVAGNSVFPSPSQLPKCWKDHAAGPLSSGWSSATKVSFFLALKPVRNIFSQKWRSVILDIPRKTDKEKEKTFPSLDFEGSRTISVGTLWKCKQPKPEGIWGLGLVLQQNCSKVDPSDLFKPLEDFKPVLVLQTEGKQDTSNIFSQGPQNDWEASA